MLKSVGSSSGGGGGASPANPTAVVGLAAVNGSAATFLRSDGAPALDQSIAPTWTSIHEWSLAEPRLLLNESDQGSNLKLWDVDLNGGVFAIRTRTDADAAGLNAIAITRGTTTNLTDISVGNATSNPTFHFLGTGLVSVANGLTAQGTITAVGTLIGQGSVIESSRTTPSFVWNQTGASTDLKNWLCQVNSTTLAWGTATDAANNTLAKNFLSVVRGATTAVASLSFGNATDNPTYTFLGTGGAQFNGTIGFNATTPIAKPTVTGSKGANAALGSLMTALAAYGLVTDSTT